MTQELQNTDAADSVVGGLLSLAVDALRQMPRQVAIDAIAGLDTGASMLTFSVTMNAMETVILPALVDSATGAAFELPPMRIHPAAGGTRSAGAH